MRTFSSRVRFNEDEYGFIQRLKLKSGYKTDSEAIRFAVNLSRLFLEGKIVVFPSSEVLKALRERMKFEG